MRCLTWYKLNNLEDNENYCKKILEKFNMKKYHFVSDSFGSLALIIDLGLNSYKVEMDKINCRMIIKKKDIKRKAQKHPKEYLKIVRTVDRDCIYNAINWISNDSKI